MARHLNTRHGTSTYRGSDGEPLNWDGVCVAITGTRDRDNVYFQTGGYTGGIDREHHQAGSGAGLADVVHAVRV